MGDTLRVPMSAGATIYQGGMVCVNADGYAVPAADAADYKMVGVACEDPQHAARSTYDNSAGGDGDMFVVVRCAGRFRFKYESPVLGAAIDQNMMMAWAHVQDDQTLSVHPWDSANDILAGYVVRLPGETLQFDPRADMDADEIEIELLGQPFWWEPDDVTTTTAEATTTTTAPQ